MAQYDINLREYWRILKKRKFIVILTAIILGSFSTAFAVFRAPAPVYKTTCSIKFEKQTSIIDLYAQTLTWSTGDYIETQMSVIKSYSVFEKVAQELGRIPKRSIPAGTHLKASIVRVIDNLQSKVQVSREKYTNILNIQVTDSDPLFAQKLANTVALTYKQMYSENQMKRTTEAIKYIESQLARVRQKLREAEEAFDRFSRDNQLLSIDLQSENLLARTQEIQAELRKLEESKGEIKLLLARLDNFIKNPSGTGGNFYSVNAGAQYQSTNSALVELLLKKASLLQDYTPQHPEIIAINRRVVENARKMKLLLQIRLAEIKSREAEARKALHDLQVKTNALMGRKLEYDRLKRKVDLYHEMTTLLERKHQEVLIRKAEKPEEVTIVRPALLPSRPINPPKTKTTGAMGVAIGLVLGMIVAFVVETFDTSLGAIEDIEETLNTQVLGVIPQADARDIRESLKTMNLPDGAKKLSVAQTVQLVAHFSPKSMIAESFRGLRTNIQFKDVEDEIKAIAVTSASPQEGKTLVSINLAITMAQAGVRTLLIGSDMRKPMIERAFGVEIAPGLSEILLGNYAWKDTVKTITDIMIGKMSLEEVMVTPGLDNLHIITSGTIPPNPAELIESRRLKEFLEEAKKEYDLIIFDSPPILSTADAVILGSKMDGVLLVYRVGAVSKGLLKRSTAQLEHVKCRILGVVLNGMKPDLSPDFHDFKYYKYYYSYGESGKGRKRKKRAGGLFSSESRKDRSSGRKAKKSVLVGAVMVGAAIAFLAVGMLWQNGMIDPTKLLDLTKRTKKTPALKVRGTTYHKKPDSVRRPSPGKKNVLTAPKTARPDIQKPVVKNKIVKANQEALPATGTLASEIKAEEMQKLVSETVRTFLSEEKQGNK